MVKISSMIAYEDGL